MTYFLTEDYGRTTDYQRRKQARTLRDAFPATPDTAIANMANLCACLRDTFHFWWVGFYRVCGEELLLGPFQGPLACTRIKKGRGVCGSAWQQERCIIVPDVEEFPGHIACSSASRSEIVLPLFKDNNIVAVLDIDSEHLNHFDDIDRLWLEKILTLL